MTRVPEALRALGRMRKTLAQRGAPCGAFKVHEIARAGCPARARKEAVATSNRPKPMDHHASSMSFASSVSPAVMPRVVIESAKAVAILNAADC